jgi:hypothetical protein
MVPLKTGGVLFYPVTPQMVAPFQNVTAREMATREARVSFGTLLNAAERYTIAGLPLSALSPWQAQRLNLLALPENDSMPVPADPHWWRNLWLGPWGESMVGVGIAGDYENLRPLVDTYGVYATDVFFPFPKRLVEGRDHGMGRLLITFKPEGLRRAASMIATTPPTG